MENLCRCKNLDKKLRIITDGGMSGNFESLRDALDCPPEMNPSAAHSYLQ